MITALMQVPIPDLGKYGFYGVVLAIMLVALGALWKKLGTREELLLDIANHHSDQLMQLTLNTNDTLHKLTDAIENQATATKELASKIETVISMQRKP